MKSIARKAIATIYTLIAISIFAWMAMRPEMDIQATGFGLLATNNTTAIKTPIENTTSDITNTDTTTEKKGTEKSNVEKNTNKQATDSKKEIDLSSENTTNTTDKTKESQDSLDTENNKEQTLPNSKSDTSLETPVAPIAPATRDNTNNQQTAKKKLTRKAIPIQKYLKQTI